eukprot:TRINITY_DN11128_c0_g1_i1.p1 TRINITY_DN11128_c0_g1~~TRINITY_DN11128_c0_g1_i1.p1  ORF type:complete len:437 (+),score=75.35 TRINITY_DN11128_c0_g1_i1:115-1425(+)
MLRSLVGSEMCIRDRPIVDDSSPFSPIPERSQRTPDRSGCILPEDIIRRLMMRLGPARYVGLAAVCRTWESIASGIGQSLTLRKCASSPDLSPFTARRLQCCCIRFRLLRRLSFEDSRSLASHTVHAGGDFGPDLFDDMATVMSNWCPELTHLGLSRCCIADEQLHQVVGSLGKLVSLTVDRCPLITARGMASLPGMEQLQILGLVCMKTLSNKALCAMGERAPKLQHLDVSSCLTISASCFTDQLSGLMSLSLGSCEWVTDHAVDNIARGCSGLLTLNVAHCDAITDAGVTKLVARLPSLQSINLSWCTSISGAALQQLCTLSRLQELFVEGCSRITAADVLDVSASVTGIQVLCVISVARCPRVTDMAVAALGKRCKMLQHLDISNCPKVTEAGLVDMMISSTSLQTIVAKGVDADLALLSKHVPSKRRPNLVT